MEHFFGKLVDVVLPRLKDWPGVKGTSGDSSGNITFGLSQEQVALFPEIEVNYDM
jgi:large subunit ribosomal protein L5